MAELIFSRLPVTGFPMTTAFGEWLQIGEGASYQHRGVDYGCPTGTPVVAPAPGRVSSFTNNGTFGLGVCLHHPGTPWFSLYAHLSRIEVAIGDAVVAGQQLGLSGATGYVTGPHLHWQVCSSSAFPVDIAKSADPLSFYDPNQEDEMDERRLKLLQVAFGDFARMSQSYELLRSRELVPDDGLRPFAYDGGLADLNNAMVRRCRVAEVAAGDSFSAAYDVLRGGS